MTLSPELVANHYSEFYGTYATQDSYFALILVQTMEAERP